MSDAALTDAALMAAETADFEDADVSEFIADDADRLEDRAPDSAAEDDIVEPEEKPGELKRWSTKPSVADQMTRFPDTCRLRGRTTAVLDLSKPTDLERLNNLQRDATDADNPSCVIIEQERQFHAGSWVVYLTYATIEYQVI